MRTNPVTGDISFKLPSVDAAMTRDGRVGRRATVKIIGVVLFRVVVRHAEV